jgi:arylsulfatase A-like enzyme/Tfp pilus assembly protein PilF
MMGIGRARRVVAVGCCLALLGGLARFMIWPRQRINLVLITLDTTRADRLGCYGYEPALTPVLDQLATGGVLFENAYTPCPLTFPSHSTMFTGLTPREHGVHHNGGAELDSQIPTLADGLRSLGYETGGFVGAFVLNRKFGLSRGFRHYDDFTGAEIDGHQVHRRRGGQLVVDAALDWLKTRAARPFFCWVHLFDPHGPYKPREELFGERFVERPYDAGLAFADQQIGRIIEFLDRQNLRERTLIVVVGDHGEGLGEHDELEHGHMLYNSTLRVPLLIFHPSLCRPGQRITQVVSLVDLLPTFQECLGLGTAGPLSGRSLSAALLGKVMAPRLCYGETDVPYLEHRWAPQRSLINGNWKYIRSPRPELYDLAQDPHELYNLIESHAEKLKEMEALLADTEAKLAVRRAGDAMLSSADRRALASLGYMANHNGDGNDQDQKELPDIKDRLKYHYAIEEANRLLDQNCAEEALVQLQEIVRSAPETVLARMYLGEALAKTGELDAALDVFRELAQSEPERGEVHSRIGWILGQQGHLDEALLELRQALELAPDSAEYRASLGVVFLELKRPEEARELFQSAVAVDPVNGNFEIAKVLASAGDIDGAIRHYKLTLQHDPNWVPLYTEIATQLARQMKFDEALVFADRAIQMSPRDADVHYNLGVMYAQQGKFDQALGPFIEALRLNPRHERAAKQLKRAQLALQSRNGNARAASCTPWSAQQLVTAS